MFGAPSFRLLLITQTEPMKDASEDEQEDDFAIGSGKNDSEPKTNSKARREEKLRNMMDEDGDCLSQ